MDIDRSVRTAVRRAARGAGRLGRRAGVLPYEPERWTDEQWATAYGQGTLAYYGDLGELARYSVLVGYVGWFTEATGRRPSILDVGCGTGLLRRRLGDHAAAEYVGIDLSASAIEEAAQGGHPNSRFLVGDVTSVDIGRFDVVVVNEVLYYAPDTAAFLDRMGSVLDPDGLLLVSMWRHPGDRLLWRQVDRAFPLMDRVDVRNRANPVNGKGWRVAAYGKRPVTPGS